MKHSSILSALVLSCLPLSSACSDDVDSFGIDAGTGGGTGASPSTGGATSAGGTTSGGAFGSGGATVASGGTSSGGATGAGGSTTQAAIAEIVTEALWNQAFPNRNALFSYQAFLTAAAEFPAFGTSGTDEMNRREIAAFFANIAHETTGGWPDAPGGHYAWGLHFKEEVGCEGGCGVYSIGDTDYPCAPGKFYHGRGPIQISYCYNYGPAGEHIGVDLLAQPELLSTDGVIAFRTAFWFWMNGTSGGKPTAHAAIHGAGGFGGTINVINGIECGGANPVKVESRVNHYKHFVPMLVTTEGSPLTC